MNFQAIFKLYIDGLSFIQVDPYWSYYLLYKVTFNYETSNFIYSIAGYATVYDFWKERKGKYNSRIGQFLILPPYQTKGLGKELLDVQFNKQYRLFTLTF